MDLIKLVSLDEELKKNPELKKEDIEELSEWCQNQPHLPQITDSELVLFLHSNYYNLKSTKNTIDTFYRFRTHIPEFFSNRDPLTAKDILQIKDVIITVPLEKSTSDGYKVMYIALLDFDPSNYDCTMHMKLLCMTMDLWMYGEGTTKGLVILVDLKGLAMGHVSRLNPMVLKRLLDYLHGGLPIRLKEFHFINSNTVMDILMTIMRPFTKKEVLDILHLHQKVDAIEKFSIPVEILPNESGGKAGPQKVLAAEQLEKMQQHRNWFIQEEKTQRIDESKLPQKSKRGFLSFWS